VFDAALRRTGAVRVNTFVQLFSAAKCLASRYRPVGHGWPSSATAAARRAGGRLAGATGLQLGARRRSRASAGAGAAAARHLTDLLDLSEEAGAEHYAAAIRSCAQDPTSMACW
jgi:acetyltransferase